MHPKKWQRIKQVFNEAVGLPVGGRSEFVRRELDGDLDLLAEVEKMLAADDSSDVDDRLEKNAFEHFTNGDQLTIPKIIGEYRIIRELGRGGMGAVYEAVRETENFTQRVALKVIKRGMDTDAILSRFRHEQQILSSLEHPNIAGFLDGGMTADNLPFYAMEYVEGEFIDDYCKTRNLTIKQRLDIFRKVCDAVQFAHQNLVIHRDLKPKNILVTKVGTPKLLDFGIGKILSPESSGEIGTATKFGMMTPAYASPEQIRGERIGTSSDLYSLGVILFELLTGEKPYSREKPDENEIRRAILETEPTKPSLAVGSQRLASGSTDIGRQTLNSKILKGDLDNIILKTLRKDPRARYSSVQEFSEDIRRHLSGLPVYARPLTLKYRASKFFQRNKISVIAGLLVILSLVTGTSIAIWQAYEAHKSAQIAQRRFEDVRQLANNVVFKYHDAIADLPGSTDTRQMLVTDALKYLDSLAASSTDNPGLRKELARAFLKMGDVQGKMYQANIGDTEGAVESYKKAVDLMERVVDDFPKDIEAIEILVKAYDSSAFLILRTGNSDASKDMVKKAIRLHESVVATEPNNDIRKIQLIELLVRLGDVDAGTVDENNIRNGEQQIETKLNHHLNALPLAENLYESDKHNYEKVRTLARVYQRIGTDYHWLGEQAERLGQNEKASEAFPHALTFHTKCFEMVQKMLVLQRQNNITQRYFSVAMTNMALSLATNGEFEKALNMAGENMDLVVENLTIDKSNKEVKLDHALAFSIYADVYFRQGKYRKAAEMELNSLTIDKDIFKSDAQNKEAFVRIFQHHEKLAVIYKMLGDKPKAGFHDLQYQQLSGMPAK